MTYRYRDPLGRPSTVVVRLNPARTINLYGALYKCELVLDVQPPSAARVVISCFV